MPDQQVLPTEDYVKCLRVIGNWQTEIDRLRSLVNMKEGNLALANALLNFPELITEDIDALKDNV